jgi:Domain of unknown function (DUF2382)
MLGTGEEAEVSKTARVVGEVSLSKRTNKREQTVRDTVRRTEAEAEELEPSSRKGGKRRPAAWRGRSPSEAAAKPGASSAGFCYPAGKLAQGRTTP